MKAISSIIIMLVAVVGFAMFVIPSNSTAQQNEVHKPITTEYTVVESRSVAMLISSVNKRIEDGWKPLGGVGSSNETDYYTQAMTK